MNTVLKSLLNKIYNEMKPTYKSFIDFLYVLIVCNVNGLMLKIKELKEQRRPIQFARPTTKTLSKKTTTTIDKSPIKSTKSSQQHPNKRAAELYLNEKLLRVVKSVEPLSDSKSIVDRATKRPVEQVLSDLALLNENDHESIIEFIQENFHEPGIEIVGAELSDWSSEPQFLTRIQNQQLKSFASHLNLTWLYLCKKFDSEKLAPGCVSSHLDMKHPFVVPGGRFREIYYWDTYWTMEGLFVCDLSQTARHILENFIHFIDSYGFIPNGSRVYYLNRSQPPYFCQMVARYLEHCAGDSEAEKFVLDEALPRMIREYEFWMKQRSVRVRLSTRRRSRVYRLNLYRVDTSQPRPESFHEDLTTASQSSSQVYKHIASAAESGYDFSSRWFADPTDFGTIQTSEILPVDLNALIYKNETIIADLLALKGDLKQSSLFRSRAARRRFAMNTLMWSPKTHSWCDFNMRTGRLNSRFYISNLSPLWMDMAPPKSPKNISTPKSILLKHQHLLEKFECGIPVSMISTDQQWDYNNVWAPNQHSMIMMLMKYDRNAALRLARKFFATVYEGWINSGAIFEKYDVREVGKRGRGGEYEVQSGFGWTNGVVLSLIHVFGDELV